VPVLVDGAQAAPRLKVDVRELDCDFYTFSGHKMYGPTGVGILFGKEALLEAMPPWQGGGDMIRSVTFEKTTYNILPYKFEAGTPNIAGSIGLGAAIDYIGSLGIDAIEAHENDLLAYATERLTAISGLRVIGTAAEKAAVLSFTLEGVHPHDVGTVLDREGVAVRTGHHCAQPVMDFFQVPATSRASFGLYNTRAEVDVLFAGLEKVVEMFRP
jgi:cysteine desulfurase/selenocysteine lyase